jgi:hypothetical protein
VRGESELSTARCKTMGQGEFKDRETLGFKKSYDINYKVETRIIR